MKNKKNYLLKSKLLMLSIPLFVACPIIATTVSCSNNSLESKLKKLIDDQNIIDVEINVDEMKSVKESASLEIKDIFDLNCETIKIIPSEKMISWNENLTEEQKRAYKIETELKFVQIPEMPENENTYELTKIDVWVLVTGGPYSEENTKAIKKTIDLTSNKYNDINKQISLRENNYFNQSPKNYDNNVWKSMKNIIDTNINLNDIKPKINDTEEELRNKLNFSVENKYQNNVYCSFSSKDVDGVYVNIYTNNQKIDTNEENITNECVSWKIFIEYSNEQK